MSYYQGDYYQGDYYQGDPGWKDVFKKFGKFAGKAVGLGLGMFTGGAGLVAGGATALASRSVGRRVLAAGATGAGLAAASGLQIPLPGPNVMRPFSILPGGVPFIGPPDLRQQQGMSQAGCCPSGFHFNKQTSTAQSTFGAPAGSICVRNRSMNVANPRALRRGLRRVSGFAKLAARARKDIKKAAKAV
jgi:hypothetical protein